MIPGIPSEEPFPETPRGEGSSDALPGNWCPGPSRSAARDRENGNRVSSSRARSFGSTHSPVHLPLQRRLEAPEPEMRLRPFPTEDLAFAGADCHRFCQSSTTAWESGVARFASPNRTPAPGKPLRQQNQLVRGGLGRVRIQSKLCRQDSQSLSAEFVDRDGRWPQSVGDHQRKDWGRCPLVTGTPEDSVWKAQEETMPDLFWQL